MFGIRQPVALVVGFQDVNQMGQAVQQCPGQPFAAQHLRLLFKWEVGGDVQACAFIRSADDIEEQSVPVLENGTEPRH